MRLVIRSLLLLCLAPAAFAQVIGFAVTSDASTSTVADRLHRINLESGEAVAIGAIGPGFEDVEGLAFDRNGALFGIDDATKTLLSISVSTGRGTAIGSGIGNTRLAQGESNIQDPSLAFSCSNDLFVVAKNARTLYRADLATGALEPVGSIGATAGKITDIAFRSDVLFGLGEDALYQINPMTGVSTLVGNYGNGVSFVEGGGLAVDTSGRLWAVAEIRRADLTLEASVIYQINPMTGAATRVASTVVGIESLSIAPTSCNLQPLGPAGLVSQVPATGGMAALLLAAFALMLGLIAVRKNS
jgi:hypothetical protein